MDRCGATCRTGACNSSSSGMQHDWEPAVASPVQPTRVLMAGVCVLPSEWATQQWRHVVMLAAFLSVPTHIASGLSTSGSFMLSCVSWDDACSSGVRPTVVWYVLPWRVRAAVLILCTQERRHAV
jgi:hypothetical protein